MGLFISLFFNFQGVGQKEWEEVYQESKQLLAAFPAPLMRYMKEKAHNGNRLALTSQSSIRSQTKIVRNPEKSAKNMGTSVLYFIQINKKWLDRYLTSMDREFLLEKITEADYESGVALTDRAWKVIDEEQNLSFLKGILCLLSIKNDEMNFWHWRIYILEHKELWPYIAYNEEALKNIESLPGEDQ